VATTTTYVLGLGNVLMGDDGFGPTVVHAFQRDCQVDGDVEVVDLGTPGLDLTPWFADAGHVIVIDTVSAPLPSGTLCVYEKSDLAKHAPCARVSPHDPGVRETVATLEFAGRAPREVTIIGVVPQTTALSTELSAPVTAALPEAVEAVAAALERSGLRVRRCGQPSGPLRQSPAWWMTPAAG
jgi:hydrogenase maturation protease